jgi:chromosome segregation ATPase
MQVMTDELRQSNVQNAEKDEFVQALQHKLESILESVEHCQDKTDTNKIAIEGIQTLIELIMGRLDQSHSNSATKEEVDNLKTELVVTQQRAEILEATRQKQHESDIATKQSIEQLNESLTERVNTLRAEHEAHLEGLMKICEEQKEQLDDQQELMNVQKLQLAHQASMIEGQTTILDIQRKQLEEHKHGLHKHNKKIEKWGFIMEHLEKTVPAFMTDLKIVDDKIEDFLEQYREEHVVRKAQKQTPRANVVSLSKFDDRGTNKHIAPKVRRKGMRPRLGKRSVRIGGYVKLNSARI